MSPITTPFGFSATATEVLAGVNLAGKRAVVTGGASGIGVETARELARAGADVTIAVRNIEAGNRVASDIAATTGAPIRVAPLDLTSRTSIVNFANSWSGPLHILVNNAGVMACPETRTSEGWELQFATNHLGHFRLALNLHKALAEAKNARVVSVSSRAHLRSDVMFADIHFERRPYDPWLAYGQSKTANILFAIEANEQWKKDGITTNALMPGGILTRLMRYLTPEQTDAVVNRGGANSFPWKTPEQGAATSVLLAASPLLEGVGGRYFEDCNQAKLNTPPDLNGVAPYALDSVNAKRLWEISLNMLDVS